MFRVKALVLAPLACLFFATPSLADIYITAKGGYEWNRDRDVTDTTIDSDFDFEFEGGRVLGGAVGIRFLDNWRIEGEILHRKTKLESATLTTISTGVSGSVSAAAAFLDIDERTLSFMGNFMYDIQTDLPFTPYVGVGIGAARIKQDGTILTVPFSRKEGAFAYQAIVGGSYEVTEGIHFSIDGRYFGTKPFTGNEIRNNYFSHQSISVMGGLTFDL